jgi:hypothetical protein
MRMARADSGLEKLEQRADARPWWLSFSGCDGDGNVRKKSSVRSIAALGVLFIRVPPDPPVAAPSTVRSSLRRLCVDNLAS